jgi:hypothetical protein
MKKSEEVKKSAYGETDGLSFTEWHASSAWIGTT